MELRLDLGGGMQLHLPPTSTSSPSKNSRTTAGKPRAGPKSPPPSPSTAA
jgi:hypothetical protein